MDEIKICGEFDIDAIASNSKPELFSKGGVYLWTLKHQNKLSIVYVGETNSFTKRFNDYKTQIPKGKHYFIIPSATESVYSLLQDENCYKLFEQKKLFSPEFKKLDWVYQAAKVYKDKLIIFLLPFDDEFNNSEFRLKYEKCIQEKLVKGLKIPPYDNNSHYRFGNTGLCEESDICKLKLLNIPDEFDEKTRKILERF